MADIWTACHDGSVSAITLALVDRPAFVYPSPIRTTDLEHGMATIIYDLIYDRTGDLQAHHGSLTACRACGSVVAAFDQEKHTEWHAKLDASTGYQPSSRPSRDEVVDARMEADAGVFSEGTGVSVLCPHCGGMNCAFDVRNPPRVYHRHVLLNFRCTGCENEFSVTFRGSRDWTGMVTKSK